jgi:phosphatidylserine/phosphatidylglycerophosphate/cardiolipin synthase-like enzyme
MISTLERAYRPLEVDHYQINEYSLIKSKEYPALLLNLMEHAQKRIWLQSMNLENDHMVGLIFHLASLKASEGLDVRLNVDGFSNMVTDGKLNVIPSLSAAERSFRTFRRNSKRELIERLKTAGVKVTETNWPVPKRRHFFPPVGRNHIKVALIDDVGFLGGVNLSDKDLLREDSMLKIANSQIVAGLEQAFTISSETIHHASGVLAQTAYDQLLFDGGEQSQSLILSRVEEMLLTATQSVTICTQFAPDSFLINLMHILKQTQLNINLIVSDPQFISEDNAWLYDRIDRTRAQFAGTPLTLFPGWLHAKIVAVDMETDQSRALYGTHNFVAKGSKWGNEELALYTENPAVLTLLNAYLEEIRGSVKDI